MGRILACGTNLVYGIMTILWLFGQSGGYRPIAADHFKPHTIVLTKGWKHSATWEARAKVICDVYRQAKVLDMSDVPHSRVDLGQSDLLSAHRRGKQTLVVGIHNSAVRFSPEQGNT